MIKKKIEKRNAKTYYKILEKGFEVLGKGIALWEERRDTAHRYFEYRFEGKDIKIIQIIN